jgi:multicomponent Na+:H+ antiporter subunit A
MIYSVLYGFIAAFVILLAGKQLKGSRTIWIALVPLGLFVYYLSFLPAVANGEKLIFEYTWIPSLGIRMDFVLDGLSLLFCLLITGIGSIVFLYASPYMKGQKYTDRFFCYLSIFMASMLGLVLSDNLLTLFVFWELTSISSFFLIGFDYKNVLARKNALLALAVTGGGGFFLLAGFILMGNITGSYSIAEMIGSSALLRHHELYVLIIFLIAAGAFTKSAQFPFHSWLPAAMVAPTPVSTYLHSATMVKAGVYLLARLTPALGDSFFWNNTLMLVGGITMIYAATRAVFKTDLKSILAYTTISVLGMLIFLLGIGTQEAILAMAVLILAHAMYKAGLFLVAGVIDHETGTRNVTRLAGLRHVMMPVAVAGLLAVLSAAGIPFTFGFITKEIIYESTLHAGIMPYVLTAAVVLSNIFLLYAGSVAGIKPFAGKLPTAYRNLHLPPLLMWLLPLLLGVGGIFAGVFPETVNRAIIQPIVAAVYETGAEMHLKIWHGFNTVLVLSLFTIITGAAIYLLFKPRENRLAFLSSLHLFSPKKRMQYSAQIKQLAAQAYKNLYRIGYLRTYILVIILFLAGFLSFRLFTGMYFYIDKSKLHEITLYEAVTVIMMLGAIVVTVFTASRLIAVAAMGVVGYCICLLFVFYSAPDLAMTQFTIDTLTVVLFVLVLFRLPPFLRFSNLAVKIRDAVVSLGFGALISIIALEVLNEQVGKEISSYYAENAYQLAKGKNVVNVILVDFRGFDTMIEIIVIAIAAIGVYSILKLKISVSEKE